MEIKGDYDDFNKKFPEILDEKSSKGSPLKMSETTDTNLKKESKAKDKVRFNNNDFLKKDMS